ncbi:Dienelactone hydrolase protein [Rutstroemia sp. NJR-2017a BVV2]|nr:Dienelactone hydrolase protein [Rutstroemia sp. NJR-2017a BVV2]
MVLNLRSRENSSNSMVLKPVRPFRSLPSLLIPNPSLSTPFSNPSPSDVVGPSPSPSAILLIYDIFGFWTQTLHGADTLSLTATSTSPGGIKIFVPDWFDGEEADIANWPADTDQKWEYIKAYFQKQADPEKTLKRMESVMEAIGKEYGEIENWGVAGYCWGGKIVTLASQAGTRFKVGAQTHPSLVEPEDAKLVVIPQIVLPSMDEDPEVGRTISVDQIAAYEENLKVEKYFERFGDQVHGWMSSKGDLENPSTREAFYRGYELWSNFFAKHL